MPEHYQYHYYALLNLSQSLYIELELDRISDMTNVY